MRQYMDEAASTIKRRQPDQAAGKGQLAMTSMNNLALMLSDVLKQMQEQMQQQQGAGGGGKPKKGKPKPGQGSPSLSQLQQQLNSQMQQLQKSGKTGRGLSEQVAKMAAQQEAIRRALAQMEKGNAGGKDQKGQKGQAGQPGGKPDGQPGGEGEKGENGNQPGGLKGQMEQTERELVNKRITEQTIRRQQDILTRLLEAEKATREREQDQKREAHTAQATPPPVPPALRKYIADKKQMQEQMQGNLPNLIPFLREANERYFRKIYR